MAPIPESAVDTNLKTIIQTLYELQSSTHGYQGPATQAVLVSQIQSLATSLATLSHSANADEATTPNTTLIPPEIIAYVEEGRNPDIYTREFVELVQRGNVVLKGKSEALMGFADVLGGEMDSAGVGKGEGEAVIVVGEKKEEKKREEEEEERKGLGTGKVGDVKGEVKREGI